MIYLIIIIVPILATIPPLLIGNYLVDKYNWHDLFTPLISLCIWGVIGFILLYFNEDFINNIPL